MKKYRWIIETPNSGSCEVSSFAKAVEQLSGRPCFASLTHRRFLKSSNVIYYPQGYAIKRICPTHAAPDAGRAEVSSGQVTPPAQVS